MSLITFDDYMGQPTSSVFSGGRSKLEEALSVRDQLKNQSAKLANQAHCHNRKLLELYEQSISVEEETRDLIRQARKMKNHLDRLTQKLCSNSDNDYCL